MAEPWEIILGNVAIGYGVGEETSVNGTVTKNLL